MTKCISRINLSIPFSLKLDEQKNALFYMATKCINSWFFLLLLSVCYNYFFFSFLLTRFEESIKKAQKNV